MFSILTLKDVIKREFIRILMLKPKAVKMLNRKKKSWTFHTLYIELDSLDPEILP